MLRIHPSFRRLSRWADATSPHEDAQLARHLRLCERCRAELRFLRELGNAARSVSTPSPPAELLSQILDRRRRGDRVLVPVATPTPAPRRLRWAGGLAAAVLLAAGLFVLPTGDAVAGASALTFAPRAPQSGQELVVRYRPAASLAGRSALKLRARYRAAEDRSVRDVLGRSLEITLLPADDGLYAGTMRIPASAVYLVFAVEDAEGRTVDANSGRLWDLLVHDAEGVPLFPGLRQQFLVRQRRDLPAALETARRMTELYPDRAEGWAVRNTLARLLETDGRAQEMYRPRFRELETAAFSARFLAGAEIASLALFARQLGDSAATEYWNGRLRSEAPENPSAGRLRYLEALRAAKGDDSAMLAWAEGEWGAFGPATPDVTMQDALNRAVRLGDGPAVLRWAARVERVLAGGEEKAATTLLRIPDLRAEGLRRLRDLLGAQEGPGRSLRRPLDESVPDYARRQRSRARQLRARAATELLRGGDVRAAREMLEPTAATAYEPAVWAALARVRLADGDTAAARRAAVSAGVGLDGWRGATATGAGPLAGGSGRECNRIRREARAELDRRILSGLSSGALAGSIEVEGPAGVPVQIDSLLAGRVTFVAVWTHIRSEDLPRLDSLAGPLRRAGIGLLVLAAEPRSRAAAGMVREAAPSITAYFIGGPETLLGFRAFGVPAYRVVDSTGRLYYLDDDLENAVRQAVAVRRRGQMTSYVLGPTAKARRNRVGEARDMATTAPPDPSAAGGVRRVLSLDRASAERDSRRSGSHAILAQSVRRPSARPARRPVLPRASRLHEPWRGCESGVRGGYGLGG
ncbi:MAG: hypothetical protein ACE5HF_04725 [Gemmatimonadota bacterium]